MESTALQLRDALFSLTVRVREIRALTLIDQNGLPLVSTLGNGALEDAVAAFGGAMTLQLARAQRDFEIGPLYQAHIVGRDRQLFVTPVSDRAALVALVDANATPATVTMHLLALAREILQRGGDPAGTAEADSHGSR